MPARARRTDPDTSHEAARSISEEALTAGQRAVLAVLRAHGPLADHELDTAYEAARVAGGGLPMLSPSGIRTRRSELADLGLVQWWGETKTPSGRRALTWRVTPTTDQQTTLDL